MDAPHTCVSHPLAGAVKFTNAAWLDINYVQHNFGYAATIATLRDLKENNVNGYTNCIIPGALTNLTYYSNFNDNFHSGSC